MNPGQEIAGILAHTTRHPHKALNNFNLIITRISADKTLLTDTVLDALTAIAANSPFRDIDTPGGGVQHPQTSAQDVCLRAVRTLGSLARVCPDKAGGIVGRLETLAQENLDYDIRDAAAQQLWMAAIQQDPLKSLGVAALERQGKTNSNHFIRIHVRDNLLGASNYHADLLPRAIDAQIAGAGDEEPEARKRAVALLSNQIADASPAQAEKLFAIFYRSGCRSLMD